MGCGISKQQMAYEPNNLNSSLCTHEVSKASSKSESEANCRCSDCREEDIYNGRPSSLKKSSKNIDELPGDNKLPLNHEASIDRKLSSQISLPPCFKCTVLQRISTSPKPLVLNSTRQTEAASFTSKNALKLPLISRLQSTLSHPLFNKAVQLKLGPRKSNNPVSSCLEELNSQKLAVERTPSIRLVEKLPPPSFWRLNNIHIPDMISSCGSSSEDNSESLFMCRMEGSEK